MAQITATEVKKLRDATGVGMMDSKKALTEAQGDFDKAVQILRENGLSKWSDRNAERTASEGMIVADGGAMLEVNCETDFVAKNEQFGVLGAELATFARDTKPADVAALLASDFRGQTVEHHLTEQSAVIGEKIAVSKLVVFDGETAVYLHRRSSDLPPQVGVMVEFTGADSDAARNAAMQVAAMKPQYLSRDLVPADIVANEREIAETLAKNENKPERAIPKIVDGRVNAFFKDWVLLDQPSVQDPKTSVGALLERAGVTLTRFARFEVGQS